MPFFCAPLGLSDNPNGTSAAKFHHPGKMIGWIYGGFMVEFSGGISAFWWMFWQITFALYPYLEEISSLTHSPTLFSAKQGFFRRLHYIGNVPTLSCTK